MIVRYLFTAGFGLSITLGLFFAMQALIGSERAPEAGVPTARIAFAMERIMTPPQSRRPRRIEKNEVVRPPEPPKLPPIPTRPQPTDEGFGVTPLPSPWGKRGPGPTGPSDGELHPMVRLNPTYPPRAVARGIEGWVLLEFTVSKVGTVKDVRVVDAEPSAIFNAAATRAVRRWKYKPQVEDGVPVDRTGVEVVLTFELPGEAQTTR